MPVRMCVVALLVTAVSACGAPPATARTVCDTVTAAEVEELAVFPTRWVSRGPDWPISVATDGDLLVALGLAGDVAAYDAASGDIHWVTPLDAPSPSAPLIGSTVVVVASGPRLAAIDRASGGVVWEHAIEPKPQLAFIREPDREAVVIADRNAHVSTVDALTGEPGWVVRLDKRGLSEISVEANQEVVMVSVMGPKVGRTYFALDPTSGGVRWRPAPLCTRRHPSSPAAW